MKLRNTLLITCAIVLGGCGGSTNQSIEGDWEIVFAQDGQSIIPKSDYKDLVYTYKKGKLTTTQGSSTNRSQYTVDDTKDPKQIDVVDGAVREDGIYQISGNELTIVTAKDIRARRPTSFEPGPNVTVMKLRRK
jgi:uncharacterized protein (TIGR03067 family)